MLSKYVGVFAALPLCVAIPVQAASVDLVIVEPVVWSNADNAIRVTTPNQAIANNWACPNPDSYYVLTTMSQQAQSRTLAVLLAAKAMGKPVTVRLDGCESGRPAIVSAYF